MSDLLKVKIGGHDYLCKWEPPLPHGLVYLTYFEDIVASANPVTPTSRKGPTGTYGNGSPPNGASTESIPQEGGEYAGVPALHLNYPQVMPSSVDAKHEPAVLLKGLLDGNGSISMESVMYIPTFSSQGGFSWVGIGIYTSNGYFTLGINAYSSDRGILVGFPGGGASGIGTLTPETGFHQYWPDGSSSACVSSSDSTKRLSVGLHHLAIVVDRVNNESRGYIDGVLAGTMNTATYNQLREVKPYNQLNSNILMTQFAIFADDRSTDNGATYPVPTKPYVKF